MKISKTNTPYKGIDQITTTVINIIAKSDSKKIYQKKVYKILALYDAACYIRNRRRLQDEN